MVDVNGIDRLTLLKAVWINAIPNIKPIRIPATNVSNGLYVDLLDSVLPTAPFDERTVDKHIQSGGYVDYLFGRAIKAKIFGQSNIIDPTEYDHEYGDNKFLDVVTTLREY
jgi:hypothetical protein